MNERDQIIDQSEARADALRSILRQLEEKQTEMRADEDATGSIHASHAFRRCADALAPIIEELTEALK